VSAELSKLRIQIDEIDEQMVKLLNQRADLVLGVKAAKAKGKIDVYSPARERQIIERVRNLAEGGHFPKAALEKIFVNVVSATRSLIGEVRVGYLGPEASLSFEASRKQFGDHVQFHARMQLKEMFSEVESGALDFALIPFESPGGGVYADTLDLFARSTVRIVAEVSLQAHLLLLSDGSGMHDLKRVYADAASFSLADAWLRANLPHTELILEESAVSALKIARDEKESGVLVTESLAEKVDMPVLATIANVDDKFWSRYVVLGLKQPPASGHDKTSLLCSTQNRSGALCELLTPFSKSNVTLGKIESKVLPSVPNQVVFFVDLDGHTDDPEVQKALIEIQSMSTFYRDLGSYPQSAHSY
jgi:chorismate mutase/prephenate dehydratase